MYMIKHAFHISLVALLALPVSAYADSWSCSKNNNVREVHIETTNSEAAPCNVVYKKPTEGAEDRTLWHAETDYDYCQEKAKGLIAKLETWGWVCAETIRDDSNNNAVEGDTATDSGS